MARQQPRNTSNYMALPAGWVASALNGASGSTVVAWIKPVSTPPASNNHRILTSHIGSDLAGLFVGINDANQLNTVSRSQGSDAAQARNSTATVTNSVWNHVGAVFSYSGGTVTPYVAGAASNGGSVTYGSATLVAGSPTFLSGIGGTLNATVATSNASMADAAIAEVALWNVALSASEMAALYQGISPLRIRRANLVGYWPLNSNASTEPNYAGSTGILTIVGTVPIANHVGIGPGFGFDEPMPPGPTVRQATLTTSATATAVIGAIGRRLATVATSAVGTAVIGAIGRRRATVAASAEATAVLGARSPRRGALDASAVSSAVFGARSPRRAVLDVSGASTAAFGAISTRRATVAASAEATAAFGAAIAGSASIAASAASTAVFGAVSRRLGSVAASAEATAAFGATVAGSAGFAASAVSAAVFGFASARRAALVASAESLAEFDARISVPAGLVASAEATAAFGARSPRRAALDVYGNATASFTGSPVFTETIFEVDLQGYLQESLGVAVWPGVLPSRLNPDVAHLVYNFVGGESEDSLSGPSGIVSITVQFDAYSRSRKLSAQLVERLRSKLHGFRGMMGNTEVLLSERKDQGHGIDNPTPGSELFTQRRMVEYEIFYREQVPIFS